MAATPSFKNSGASWWRVNFRPKFNKYNYQTYTPNPTFRIGRLLLYDDSGSLVGPNMSLVKFPYDDGGHSLFESNCHTINETEFTTFPSCIGVSSWDDPVNIFANGQSNKWFSYYLFSEDPDDWGVLYRSRCYRYGSVVMHLDGNVKLRKWNLRHGSDDVGDGGMSIMRWIQFQASRDGMKWNTEAEFSFDLPAANSSLYYNEPQSIYG